MAGADVRVVLGNVLDDLLAVAELQSGVVNGTEEVPHVASKSSDGALEGVHASLHVEGHVFSHCLSSGSDEESSGVCNLISGLFPALFGHFDGGVTTLLGDGLSTFRE